MLKGVNSLLFNDLGIFNISFLTFSKFVNKGSVCSFNVQATLKFCQFHCFSNLTVKRGVQFVI